MWSRLGLQTVTMMSDTTSPAQRKYLLKTKEYVDSANGHLLGVKLGRVCVANQIPVTTIAKRFGVTRQAVYNWFYGFSEPRRELQVEIKSFIAAHK